MPLFVDHPRRTVSIVAGAVGLVFFVLRMVPETPFAFNMTQASITLFALSSMMLLITFHHKHEGHILTQTQEEMILVGGFGLFWLAFLVAMKAFNHRGLELGGLGGSWPNACSKDDYYCVDDRLFKPALASLLPTIMPSTTVVSHYADDVEEAPRHSNKPHVVLGRPLPEIPDFRFETSYMATIKPFVHTVEGSAPTISLETSPVHPQSVLSLPPHVERIDWGSVIYATAFSQIVMPFVGGAMWGVGAHFLFPLRAKLSSRIRRMLAPFVPSIGEGSGVAQLRGWLHGLGLGIHQTFTPATQ